MALKQSTMLPLGTPMPQFSLPNVMTGEILSPDHVQDGTVILIMFICRHCPYVIHVQEELAKLGRDYENRNLNIVAISSNDISGYPLDAPPHLREMAENLGFVFPVCYDESQEVAKKFTAACTPDFFVFDSQHALVYRGQLDDSRPGNGKPVNGKDLRAALDATLSGQVVSAQQQPSAGCNIKWKPGHAPDYA